MQSPGIREISAQVDLICKREPLIRSNRACQLLRYLVDAVGRGVPHGQIKESVIGADVFGRPNDYDPHKDPIVRVTAKNLRAKLGHYYETEGRHDPVRFLLSPGSYVPQIFYEPTIAASKVSDKAAMHIANAKAAFDKRTLSGHEAAFRYLNLAANEHPEHPRVLSLQAMVHAARAMYGGDPRIELNAAAALIKKAKQAGHEPWERSLVEAWIRMALEFNWPAAEVLFDRAIALSHGEAKYHAWYPAFLASQLRFDEGQQILSDAVGHFAHDVASVRGDLALSQIVTGRYPEAEETLRSTLELFPSDHYLPYLHLAILKEATGNFNDAAQAMAQVPVTVPESTINIGMRYLFMGLNGERGTARLGYQELESRKRVGPQFIPASQLAQAAMGAEDYDAAADWFVEAATVERDPVMSWAALYPFGRHIHHHQVFRSLILDTMKLRFPNGQRISAAVGR